MMLNDHQGEMMNHDANGGNSIKSEHMEVKEEIKEEPTATPITNDTGGGSSNPASMTVPNGEPDNLIKSEDGQSSNKAPDTVTKVKEDSGNHPPSISDSQTTSHPSPSPAQASQPNHISNSQIHVNDPPFSHQSQVFVFSTDWANNAAEGVINGRYKNIVSFHMDQPSTKKLLQKHPMKSGQFNPGNGMPMIPAGKNNMNAMGMSKSMGFGPNPNGMPQWMENGPFPHEQGPDIPPINPNQGFPPNSMMPWPGNMSPNSQAMMGPGFPMIPENFEPTFGPSGSPHPPVNLLQNKVPNENLTPEQLQRREERIASLRKIQEMLFPEHRQFAGHGPGGPGPGMMPEGMMQQNMMASQGMMTSQQGMMASQQGIMTSQGMMSQQQFMMQNMTPAQREWMRLQHEYYSDKRRSHPDRHMGPMNPGMNGPPPSYYSSIAQKRQGSGGMSAPTSPNMDGSMPSPHMVPQGPEIPEMMAMFPGGGPRGPMEHPMGPRGPGNMNNMMHPGLGGMLEPGMMMGMHGPRMPGPGHFSDMSRLKNAQISLQRAGNPEQFVPDPVSVGSNSNESVNNKPPPSYAQAQKRKRDDMEEIYKNLQPTPTPSPQQINYLNQFEGQELTITKQLNTAFREASDTQSNSNFSHPVHSPIHGPNSAKGPLSNSSQNSGSNPMPSPRTMSGPGPSPMSAPSPLSGASMRLSHYDPPPQPSAQSSAPTTPTAIKSSMSNITSASLAHLAKGVENLSNQMQQNMMQGGPFHSIQVQNNNTNTTQQNSQPSSSNNNSNSGSTPAQSQPSVNNTYVNATMSIQQLNIQSVNAPGQGYNPTMQVQQMNNDSPHTNVVGAPAGSMPTSFGSASTSVTMSQSQSMMANMPHPGMGKTPPFPQSAHPAQMPGNHPNPMMQQQPGRGNSPGFPPTTVGNANVQVEAKAPNTIQYLPANPPANQPAMASQKRPDLDFMQRFAPPLTNLDSKVPSSKVQYYPTNSTATVRPPVAGSPMAIHQQMMMRNNSAMDMTGMGGPGPNPGPIPGPGPGPMGPGPSPVGHGHGGMVGMGSPGPMPSGMNSHSMPGDMSDPMFNMGPGNMGNINSPPMSGMNPANTNMGNMPYNSPPYAGNNQNMMPGPDMPIPGPSPEHMMPNIAMQGGMHRQPGPGPGMGMPGCGPSDSAYNVQFQQFQQQLYSQGRPRHMGPMGNMMGGPGPGPGPGSHPYMGMMPNMPGGM